jgi:ribosomal protein S18 acetylase RimI-like enzyme
MHIIVRPACEQDLPDIVGVHMRAFQGFFLTTLGPRFLFELYRGFFTLHDGRLLVAEADGKIAGFVAGALGPDTFFRSLLKARWFKLACAALGAVIRCPHSVLPRLIAAPLYRGERPAQLGAAALLSAIAVDPHVSGVGIGSHLITAYCAEASKKNFRYVYLLTDRDGNETSNRFYRRHGFEEESQRHRRNGRVMVRYVRALEGR